MTRDTQSISPTLNGRIAALQPYLVTRGFRQDNRPTRSFTRNAWFGFDIDVNGDYTVRLAADTADGDDGFEIIAFRQHAHLWTLRVDGGVPLKVAAAAIERALAESYTTALHREDT